MTDKPLSDRIVVVTGASRGIGYTLARAIAAAGAHVVAVARTVGGLEELDDEIRAAGGVATLVPLDLTDGPGVDRLGGVLYERFGRVDGLIGNAGILGPTSPLGHIAPKDWDKVMAVNVTANWRLIRSLDPLLRAAPAGRAVFVTSSAARRIRAYWGPYAVSKAALEALVVTWARETETTPLKVNLINPGRLRTKMRAAAMPGEDPETLDTPDVLVPAVLAMLAPALAESGRVWDHPTGDWLA
ncbi:SDR family NAD(P)-dependent oxidoreductase [Siculibacillus lacustris]|uniref:SDR family NAD(P)-dependent oxidoreductase n=1 Tax=Siculibacillus lacustris TaxID=1549641 RepID=A0A4Q9VUF0_9HYPH|nr:SDR family NAD(P)-dependent oxidoreductase [Siculibacillus lacustris]TBW39802.1 SDR family NAD(P)-dependent oxidoreductase [Siculibacillus lacustris]